MLCFKGGVLGVFHDDLQAHVTHALCLDTLSFPLADLGLLNLQLRQILRGGMWFDPLTGFLPGKSVARETKEQHLSVIGWLDNRSA